MANRSRKRRRSHSRESSSNAWVYAAYLIGIGFALFALRTMLIPPIQLSNIGCPVEDPDQRNWIARKLQPLDRITISILLDTTDDIVSAVKDTVINRVHERINDAAELDRIRIYVVDPSDQERLASIFDSCKPQANSGQAQIVSTWQKIVFDNLLRDALDNLEYVRPSSPIIESISSVAANFPEDGSEKEIILVSDLIQNSGVLNQYDPEWLNSYNSNPRAIDNRSPDLRGVRVTVLQILRDVPTQNGALGEWWEHFLINVASAPIEKIEIYPITG